jgi:hypothetical protein
MAKRSKTSLTVEGHNVLPYALVRPLGFNLMLPEFQPSALLTSSMHLPTKPNWH